MERALAHLDRRGPDDRRIVTGPGYAIGHTRLAIIDLSPLAAQPYADRTGRHFLAYNGEIYNHQELRLEMEDAGVVFRSHSDTEVLLEGILRYGLEPMLRRVRGMFAFVLYDTYTRRAVAARDHFGQKPLYFANVAAGVAISSDIRSLLALGAPRRPDLSAYSVYLSVAGEEGTRGNFHTDRTFFEGISALPAGHLLDIDPDGRTGTRRYFSPFTLYDPSRRARLERATEDEVVDEVRSLLDQAVARHLVADVPLGVLLSGGMDSTLIFWLSQPRSTTLTAFTKLSPGIEDIPLEVVPRVLAARPADAYFGVQSPRRYLPDLVDFLTYTAQPSRWGSGPAMYRICADARRNGIKVLLSGDCSDELFGGYAHYENQFERADRDDFGSLVSLNYASPYYNAADAAGFIARERALRAEIEAAYADVPGAAERYAMVSLCHDTTTFLQTCALPHADAYSMMTSIELRNPMLDLDLAAFALSLPMRYRAARDASDQFGKVILRELAEREIGPFMNRRKEGTRNYAMAMAKPDYWRFDAFTIRDVVTGFAPGSARDIIRLFNLELFHRIWVLGESDPLPSLMTHEGLEAIAS